MFNVGLGEIVAIVLVTMLLFGPERLPEMARQAGRFLGRLRLTTQDALDQLKDGADLNDLNLPDLPIRSRRGHARPAPPPPAARPPAPPPPHPPARADGKRATDGGAGAGTRAPQGPPGRRAQRR